MVPSSGSPGRRRKRPARRGGVGLPAPGTAAARERLPVRLLRRPGRRHPWWVVPCTRWLATPASQPASWARRAGRLSAGNRRGSSCARSRSHSPFPFGLGPRRPAEPGIKPQCAANSRKSGCQATSPRSSIPSTPSSCDRRGSAGEPPQRPERRLVQAEQGRQSLIQGHRGKHARLWPR